MRALFILAWLIISALVVWYMWNQKPNVQLSTPNTSLSSDVEVIDEVSGSIYTSNNNDENLSDEDIQETIDQDKDSEEQIDISHNDSKTDLGESPNNNPEKNKSVSNYPFLEVAYIEFNQNKVTLPKNAIFEKYLDSVARVVDEQNLIVELVGHADKSLSNKRNNMEVGMKRAEFIRDALLARNVPADKIITDSKGATEPRIDDITREANEKNRRVELFLKPNN